MSVNHLQLKCPENAKISTFPEVDGTCKQNANQLKISCDQDPNCKYATCINTSDNKSIGSIYDERCIKNDLLLHDDTLTLADKQEALLNDPNSFTYNKGTYTIQNNRELYSLINYLCSSDYDIPSPDISYKCKKVFKNIDVNKKNELINWIQNQNNHNFADQAYKTKIINFVNMLYNDSTNFFNPECPQRGGDSLCNVEDLLQALARFGTPAPAAKNGIYDVEDILNTLAMFGSYRPECIGNAKYVESCPATPAGDADKSVDSDQLGGPNRNFNIVAGDYTNICKRYNSKDEALYNLVYANRDHMNFKCGAHGSTDPNLAEKHKKKDAPENLPTISKQIWDKSIQIINGFKNNLDKYGTNDEEVLSEHDSEMHHHLTLHDNIIEMFRDRVHNQLKKNDKKEFGSWNPSNKPWYFISVLISNPKPDDPPAYYYRGPNPNYLSTSDMSKGRRSFALVLQLRSRQFSRCKEAKDYFNDTATRKDTAKIIKLAAMFSAFEAVRSILGAFGALTILEEHFKHTDDLDKNSTCRANQCNDDQTRTYITNCRTISEEKCEKYYSNLSNPQSTHSSSDSTRDSNTNPNNNYKCMLDFQQPTEESRCRININQEQAGMIGTSCQEPNVAQVYNDPNSTQTSLFYTEECENAAVDATTCNNYFTTKKLPGGSSSSYYSGIIPAEQSYKCKFNGNKCSIDLNQPLPLYANIKSPDQLTIDSKIQDSEQCINSIRSIPSACCDNVEYITDENGNNVPYCEPPAGIDPNYKGWVPNNCNKDDGTGPTSDSQGNPLFPSELKCSEALNDVKDCLPNINHIAQMEDPNLKNNGILNLKSKCVDKYLRENPAQKQSLPVPSRNPVYAYINKDVTPGVLVDESQCFPNSTVAPKIKTL